ncbi:MAG: hypothetical protein EBU88_16355, partial [Acidobacteria bacterium]|nr:hypothetical protein [Acidobacteriota bacterium]
SAGLLTSESGIGLAVGNNATLTGASISLGSAASDTLQINANASLIGVNGIAISSAGMVNFGSLTLTSSSTVTVFEDSQTDLTGSSTAAALNLTSSSLLTNTDSAAVLVTGLATVTGADINLGNASSDSMNFGSVTLISTGNVQVFEDSSSHIVGNSSAGTLVFSSGNNGILIDAALQITTSAVIHSLGASSDLALNGSITSPGGSIALRANEDVSFTSTAVLNSAGGDVQISADFDTSGLLSSGQIFMADGSNLDAGAGEIDMTAPGNITLGRVNTSSEGRLTSLLGEILDGGDSSFDLEGGSFALRAPAGIGSVNPLDTKISTFSYLNLTSGNVQIANVGGITVGSVDGLTSSFAINNTRISATSPITFAADTTQATMTAQALESGTADYDNITVLNGVILTATTGNILFEAGDRIDVQQNAVVTATLGEIILRSGFNDSDHDGSMRLAGTLSALNPGQRITLDLNSEQGAAQTSTGALLATRLRLLSNSSTSASFSLITSLLNDVDTIAASTSGYVYYRDLDDLNVSSIAGSSGIAAMAGIDTTTLVSEGAAVQIISTGSLHADQPIRTSPASAVGSQTVGTVDLQSLNSVISITENA